MQTIFEKSEKGEKAYSLPKGDAAFEAFTPGQAHLRESDIPLPEVSELNLMRHFSLLARRNFGIDTTFYPLGSCTMKYNPRINEVAAALPSFTLAHPFADEEQVQGCLRVTYELIQKLCEVTGMSAGSLAPAAGAQGEFSGVRMIAEYHKKRGDLHRDEIIVPDSAHGTNPSTARMAGFKAVNIPSAPDGDIDLEALKSVLSDRTAGLMMTNPSTLGLFSSRILEIAKLVHDSGGLLFYDGANLNAIMNLVRPAEMGFDVMHINLHKTFSTPHGGGGPGSGPVLCNERLAPFLPTPLVVKKGETFKTLYETEESIGKMTSFHGNFLIYLRAYLYILLHGMKGLRRVSEQAVLNANYLKKRLGNLFTDPYPDQPCMHEFVLQADRFLDKGVKAFDIAKALLDYGIHAPTVYFPLIVKECLLIEPTETESLATLDHFVSVMEEIVQKTEEDPEWVKSVPTTTEVRRPDEVRAAKNPVLTAL